MSTTETEMSELSAELNPKSICVYERKKKLLYKRIAAATATETGKKKS